jgi:hypothetical protein
MHKRTAKLLIIQELKSINKMGQIGYLFLITSLMVLLYMILSFLLFIKKIFIYTQKSKGSFLRLFFPFLFV